MTETARRICASTILLVVVSTAGQQACADAQGSRIAPRRIERDVQRFRMVATDNVMELLAIKPEMTILDIGAGSGQFAYEFARRLNGTGKVYATDTQERCIEYMRKEAGTRGLANFQPVLVGKQGLDEFYGRHNFDLIAIFHVAMGYDNQVDYLRELRGSLAERGRLVLIVYKIPTPFSAGDFTGDLRELIGELSREPAQSPYSGILRDSTRNMIRDDHEAVPPEALKHAVVEDFNETLSDPLFAAHFSNGSVFRKEANFSPEEARYADWLLSSIPDNSVFNGTVKAPSALGAKVCATINKLLIAQRFRKFLKRDGLFMSGFTPPIKAAFEKAGYRIEREYTDLIPFEDMIVLSSR